MQSNNIHINPNFVPKLNGERQHIHINPSFVKGLCSNAYFHHLNGGSNARTIQETDCVPLKSNGEDAQLSTQVLPLVKTQMQDPLCFTNSMSQRLDLIKNVQNVNYVNENCCRKASGSSTSVSASQVCQNNTKYKLCRVASKHKQAASLCRPSISSSLAHIEKLKEDLKSISKNNNSIMKNENFTGTKITTAESNKNLKSQFGNNYLTGQHLPNYKLIKNKYVLNKLTKQSRINDDIGASNNNNIQTITASTNIELHQNQQQSAYSVKPIVNYKAQSSSFVNTYNKSKISKPSPQLPPLGSLKNISLNDLKVAVETGCSTSKTPVSEMLSQYNGSSLLKVDTQKCNSTLKNSKHKLVLNSTNPYYKKLETINAANSTSGSNSRTSSFAIKSRTKLVRHKSVNSTKNLNSLNVSGQFNKTDTIKSSLYKPKPILKPLKKGALFKAYQNMALRKNMLSFRKIDTGYPYSSVYSSKYKIDNKLSKDIVKKYVIKRKHFVTASSKVLKNKCLNVPNSKEGMPCTTGVGQTRFFGDVISKYKVKRFNKCCLKRQKSIDSDVVSKYKINRKVDVTNKKQLSLSKSFPRISGSRQRSRSLIMSDKFINIGGSMYKSTRTSLKKLSHIKNLNTSGSIWKSYKSSPGTVKLGNNKVKMNKQQQSMVKSLCVSKPGMLLEIVRLKKLGLLKKINQFCMFYARFGKCKRNENGLCPFVHDPDKIAVCTRFLRGNCRVSDCPFSHKLDKSKMPVCSHFLKGACHKDDCPYRHVKVNPKAPVCRNFLTGHCPHGEECKKKHILICEDFQSSGKCHLGDNCPLSHRREIKQTKLLSSIGLRKRQSSVGSSSNEVVKFKRRSRDKTGVLGIQKSNSVINTLKKKSKLPSNRYFEAETLPIQTKVSSEITLRDTDASPQFITNLKPFSSTLNTLRSDILELKRKRLLKKVEKLKSLYAVGLEDGAVINLGNNDKCSSAEEKAQNRLEEDDFQLWRIPLPKVLPSFIPLILPKWEENL